MSMIVSKRIGIDCRLSGNAHAGIGRYIEELILRLPKINKEISWVLFFNNKKQADEYLQKIGPHTNNLKIVIAPIQHYTLAEQLKLPQIFAKEKLDLLHVPHFNVPIFYSGKLVVTIHDLLWHEFVGLKATTLKPYLYFLKYLAYRFIAQLAIFKASLIFVPANTIKNVVHKYYPSSINKVLVTKEGFAQEFSQNLPTKKTKPELLYVGSLYPHKNIEVVLKALSNLPNYHLNLVGARNIFQDQTKDLVTKYKVENQVSFLGYLTDKELKNKMSQAFALIQPSFSEGFGLTGIEAMAAGLPVISSNIPIFEEIYQDGAIFFNPHRSDDFVKAVKHLEQKDRPTIVNKGKEIVKDYSWDKMSFKTLTAYKTLLT